FTWSSTNVLFLSGNGADGASQERFSSWAYQPSEATRHISQKPMPVHLNLWCFQGRPPSDGRGVELVIRQFKFKPL
ncbi:MAG TPA: hypothetical protein VHI52_01485, partial [Verrucomicrobiae bacterium]|nr:hypothetical protein [Verrucomicrobiae bacterium]